MGMLFLPYLCFTGAEVLCAHTQKFLFEPMAQKAIDTQKTSTVLLHGRGTYWITAVMSVLLHIFSKLFILAD